MSLFDINKTLLQTSDSLRQLSVLNPLTIRKKGTRAKALFALSMVCFLWGTTWLASKQGVKYMPALQLAGIRQFLGGSCYVIFFLIKGFSLPKKRGMDTDPCSCRVKFFIEQWINNLEREIYFCRTCGDHRCDISFVVGSDQS